MDGKHLEIEYSPSEWSKRFSNSSQILEAHADFSRNETERNLQKYNCVKNIPYGKTNREMLDIYFKETQIGASIFAYLHGGYWQELSKNESGYCVSPFVEKGYQVIVVDYELCPNIDLDGIVKQILKAIQWILDYAKEKYAGKVILCGHSAGAHLIACALANLTELSNSYLLKSVILISGIYDLRNIKNIYVNKNNILGLNNLNIKSLSPSFLKFTNLKKHKLTIFIFVGENESPTFKEQSGKFYEHLKHEQLSVKFKIIDNCDHFNIVEYLSKDDYEIVQTVLTL